MSTASLICAVLVCAAAIGRAQQAWPGTQQHPEFKPAPTPVNSEMARVYQGPNPQRNVAPDEPLPARSSPLPHGEGAKRMGQRLRGIFDGYEWREDPNKPFPRITYYQTLLTRKLPLQTEIAVRTELGNEQLRGGRSERAVDSLEELIKLVEQHSSEVPRSVQAGIHQELALAYLRLGEQENCAGMHNALSCNFPLRGSGIHAKKRGAEGAVREYTRALELNPESYLCRWLLNIAYQQLGRYPEDVPKRWLIAPEKFGSERDIGYFTDVAGIAGIDNTELAGGVLVEDFDGDGFMDVMLSSSGPLDPMHFYRNNGDGTFTDRTRDAGLADEMGGLSMLLTDYNNDGHPDVLVLRGAWWSNFGTYPISLLRNNGDGTFDDATEEAGLLMTGPGQGAAWADYDGDGWLDLFVGRESKPGDEHRCALFHNNHDGTFTRVRAPGAVGRNLTSNLGFVKGAAWGDYNNDGRPDLYVSTMFGESYLFRNDRPRAGTGEWIFTDVTEAAGLVGKRYTFPTWFFDYDNDGSLDIFAGGYSTSSMEDVGAFMFGKPNDASVSHLFRNNRDGTFSDVPHAAGLDRAITTMSANFGDLDNDGWLDVYLGLGDPSYEALLPKKMFRNRSGQYFEDVTTSGGFGNLQKGHGIAFADLENNGNEDVLEEMGGAFPGDSYVPAIYRNPGHGNHWLELTLQGVRSNRAAFGARVKVTIDDAGHRRSIYRAVGSVSSFGGNPLRQHFGIGKATAVRELEVWWPASGTRQLFKNLDVDRMYRVREGAEAPETLALTSFEFGKSRIAHHEHDLQH